MAKDEEVIKTIQQLIKEVKQEMKQKKVLAESKQPEEVFNHHQKEIKRYIVENVLKALSEAEK